MNTKTLTKARRKRAKRAQRAYIRRERKILEVRPTDIDAVKRHYARIRRCDRLAYYGWGHLEYVKRAFMSESVFPTLLHPDEAAPI